ncbi:DamX protein [Idiomarina fontislapidosi]|uniref:SPOR domain-containing protein n=1 Tax=Idiomarina fontislapidosi TaxID=263723 RepID=A0A432XSJ0_9GAMM|nr:AAA family ATPase [Idiomarina fontislapidosi]PYE31334.1 DamX protein [Idiomarina fontislapidosi]RUO51706.1 hypothetical protein CWE25_10530 [Idiomarina fontislapidosi]
MPANAYSSHIVAAPVKSKPSQQAVIDRLHEHCQHSDTLVLLHGPQGSGKSTISELFVEQASNYAECAWVQVSERSSVERLRAQILNQLFGTISLNDETLSREIQRQRPLNHAVIVIDNGELMPDTFLAECVNTVNQLCALGQRVSIVISAESRWVFQQTPPPQLRVKRPELVEIPPLGKEEQMRFIQALLPERQRALWNLDKIQQFLATINGYPGEIQQRLQLKLMTQSQRYAEPEEVDHDSFSSQLAHEEDNLESASPKGNVPIVKILAASITLALAGLAALNYQAILDYFSPQEDATSTVVTAPEKDTSPAEDTASKTVQQELPRFEPIQSNQFEMLPAELATSYREALHSLNRVAASESDPREVELQLINDKRSLQEAEPPTHAHSLTDRQWVAQQPPQNYAVQLTIASDKPTLMEFITRNELTQQARIYQRQKDNSFVVILGSHNTIDAARAEAAALPDALRALGPWAKSYAVIQQEQGQASGE